MCGIVGFLQQTAFAEEAAHTTLSAMLRTLAHRGPDGEGLWIDAEAGIAVGHRRLAILDLSEAGHQPMISQCGRYVLTYNGEIYNALEIAHELAVLGHAFRGHCDAEVLVQACAEWGVRSALDKIDGMFAFALWDRYERTLTLVRDRFGIKPLYWGMQNSLIVFASELKALRAHPKLSLEMNAAAAASFLHYGYVPQPQSIYQDVHKLLPGHMVTITANKLPEVVCYWSVQDAADAGRKALIHDETEALETLRTLLSSSVRRMMISDVPLGAFLSGGIDSTTIVALLQEMCSQPIKTFTIGFQEASYDESPYAKAIAAFLGTDHTELKVSPRDVMAVIPDLPMLYDEPFADSSQLPTFLVSKLAGQHVKVALSGDGGDELFAGYNRHRHVPQLWSMMRHLPISLRAPFAKVCQSLPSHYAVPWLERILPFVGLPQLGEKLHKSLLLIGQTTPLAMYQSLVSFWQEDELKEAVIPSVACSFIAHGTSLSLMRQLCLADLSSYLPDDILTKVDRASMAVGLEARIPFLDLRVVNFSFSLSDSLLAQKGKGKWIVRQLVKTLIPERFIERPKMGFGMPLGAWLKGPLREWCEELLTLQRLEAVGVIRPEAVLDAWQAHQRGALNEHGRLWAVLMLVAWQDAAKAS